ncbi:MAG: heparinase II/III family protein [Paludisphaera borealis]|uniref:heparinase II/III family protein n=1 Tax=Paludisphaera borealis TaxID=1387353 RepID=UPI00284B1F96|nr:heparinase II/III family protein [Paludisphaera borealis]MDR3620851.1 heparinase II/III family protein [Paludisphaera borealis]
MIKPALRSRRPARLTAAIGACLLAAVASTPRSADGQSLAAPANLAARPSTLGAVELPKAWQDKFWQSPSAQALLKLTPKQIADLVPVQSGVRFCRCPACGVGEREDPLAWNIEKPQVVTCRRCGVTVPNDAFPAKVNNAIPEEKVEVLPGVWHSYPYHAVVAEKLAYPDERLYLNAKRDYEARAYLAKAALYAAVASREPDAARRDARMAPIACTLILRFAQVYPAYATHYDQPGGSKHLQPARMSPPYRRGYQTGKWEWNGSLEVPMNLVLAYSLIRDDPAWKEAGKLLGCATPARTVERDFLLASAELARRQPEEFTEDSLHVYRGMLAVGRLIEDENLTHEAMIRVEEFTRRGFYYDGFWRNADVRSHRRVLDLLDGWIEGILNAEPAVAVSLRTGQTLDAATPTPTPDAGGRRSLLAMVDLARSASAAVASRPPAPQVQQASWPIATSLEPARRPVLLGGAGLARLAVGDHDATFDVELRGQDSLAARHFQRLAFRISIGGKPVLDDLDERPATSTGWELATASHNTVVIDGLNQRESPEAARTSAPGSDFLFFAADPDFQVATLDDRFAYPVSASRYRETFVVSRSARSRYALSVFEVRGGLQHDQIFHAAPGRKERWRLATPAEPAPTSLLPPSIVHVASAKPEDGRWFVQAYGEFHPRMRSRVTEPCQVVLGGGPVASQTRLVSLRGDVSTTPTLRLHLLGDMPATLITATSADSPGPDSPATAASDEGERASLIVRRRSENGATLNTVFVTLFEPIEEGAPPLAKVGRVESVENTVVVLVETPDGPEHVVINRTPGDKVQVQLANGRFVTTDGVAVRVREKGVVLAGGTYAEAEGKLVSQVRLTGAITGAVRQRSEHGRGWFVSPDNLPDDPTATGRTLIVEHGDGRYRSWTLDSIESSPEGTRLHVREEPGFQIDPKTGEARYYQFPRTSAPGPHRFRVSQIAR